VVLFGRHRLGLVAQHERHAVLDPVPSAQPRVVQHGVVGEIQQAALVDRADQDVEQGVLQRHHCLPA
jgi:hypothetical protein